ncbi:MAG: OsmC family protein [Candidatus Thalassarchaeaceae archaeon]|jgi:putative redox protein|nr:OsmC family protein [Candidatus Thalassarchaeaceae archaeon]
MDGVVRWIGGEEMEGEIGGKSFGIHSDEHAGPMQMVLISHAACSFIDVIAGLKERMSNVRSAWVEVDADRAEEKPRVFTAIRMKYVIEGDVPNKLVTRIIEQSHEKLCSVGAMITGSGATLNWSLDIRE